jgi:cytochrome c oxidase assembly factor CtaG
VVPAAWAHPRGPAAGDGVAGAELWTPRAEVLLPLIGLAVLYALGTWTLSRRARGAVSWTRPACAAVGLVAMAAALVSPLDALADRSFLAHMVQHMLLIMVAAPAVLLADPLPIVLWALPRTPRATLARALARGAVLRRLGAAVTATGVAWISHAIVLWLWHLPTAYDAALASRLVHDIEHVTFFVAALLFWWPVVRPAPRLRPPAPHGVRIAYVVLAAFQGAALGLVITLAPTVLYRSYAAAHVDVAAALDDQMWGGIVMWGAGGLIDMLAVLVLLARVFAEQSPTAASSERVRPG